MKESRKSRMVSVHITDAEYQETLEFTWRHGINVAELLRDALHAYTGIDYK